MRQTRPATISDLRYAIDCLPRHTRAAMLDGIRASPIIVGAYTKDGGVCPMLAAHRSGGRTDFIGFAKAWDRFAFSGVRTRRRKARPATRRELLILETHLEASLEADAPAADLASAAREHRRLIARRDVEVQTRRETPAVRRSAARPGDRDRSRELSGRTGSRWTRVVRNLDDYERVLDALHSEQASAADRERVMRELELTLADS